MAANEQDAGTLPKIKPQPSVFFDIMAEKDIRVRKKKIDELSSGRGSPNTGDMVNILQCLAGSEYIDKKYIRTLKKIGEGGFAVVEKARLTIPGKEPEIVAIKTLKPGLIEDEIDLQELIQEANVLRKLKHRYIVNFKGIGSFQTSNIRQMRTSVFFGEEYMSGGTLKHVLARHMKTQTALVYTPRDAVRWCLQVAQALDYLHHCNPAVVHRDLKPENVLLTSTDASQSDARIADFGLHKRINKVREARVKSVRRMTHKGPVPLPSSDDASLSEIQSDLTERGMNDSNSRSSEKRGSKKAVRWGDRHEEIPPADPHQGWEDPCETNVAPSGVSSGEPQSGGAFHLPEPIPELRASTSLRSIPEDTPVLDEQWSSASGSNMSKSRHASSEMQPVALPIPLVVALEPPWEPPELSAMDDVKSQKPEEKDFMALKLHDLALQEQLVSPWETGSSMDPQIDVETCSSISEINSSSFEGKVHGGYMGCLLPDTDCSSPSDDLDEYLMLLELHPSNAKCNGAKVTNHGNGLDGLGDGGSGVDDGSQPSSSPFEQGLPLKFGRGIHTDGLVNIEEKERENSLDYNLQLPETTSAGFSSMEGSLPKGGALSNTTDSIVLHQRNQSRQESNGTDSTVEGRQRGSSQMRDLLDTASQGKSDHSNSDPLSSVYYSLGLAGTANMSGIVGSLMYMAPEVVRGKKYTEKVDIFSFGRIMFELFLGRLLIVDVLARAATPAQMEAELEKHAKKIAKGYREDIPPSWPEDIAELIMLCWHQDPQKRPRMKEVISRLEELDKSGSIQKMGSIFASQLQKRNKESKTCCIIS